MYNVFFSFMDISEVYMPLFQIKLEVLSYSMDFKGPRELWNPLSKVVPGKFHGSGGQSTHRCLQDRAFFDRSRVY